MLEYEWLTQQTPQKIYDQLSKSVFGQAAAKTAIAMALFNFVHHRPTNLLLAGPTGSGKTALIEAMCEMLNEDMLFVLDGSRLGPDGYKSSTHLSDAFENRDDCHFFLVIDEADKLLETHVGSAGTNYSQLAQNQLLLLFEHRKITLSSNASKEQPIVADTSHTSIILLGAFENLFTGLNAEKHIGFGENVGTQADYSNTKISFQNLVDYGLRSEIAGRIDDIVCLNPLSRDDFLRILDTPSMSPISRLEREYMTHITVSENLKFNLAQHAVETGLGCRAVYTVLKRMLNNAIFQDCNQSQYNLMLPGEESLSQVTRSPAYAFAYADN